MCDTIGILNKTGSLFAKNSDRSPNECQVVEYRPAMDHEEKQLKATYIEIPQARHTYGTLLSRPVWMWGAEMGVNECGVCIGNEAIFTRGPYGRTGLTGMDLLRLALERASSAKQALDTIIELLERFGQGGNCGFDHNFYYDNAFLIMDRANLFVLETKNKQWVYQRWQTAAISNMPGIGLDGNAYSGGKPVDFAAKYTDPLYTHFSGAKRRRQICSSAAASAQSAKDLFQALRAHEPGVHNPFTKGSVKSPCMHAGGIVGDHTTGSMVVELKESPVVWLTGSSVPCVSLFKPTQFGNVPVAPVFLQEDEQAKAYWLKQEYFRRKLIGNKLPDSFYRERDALEQQWLQGVAAANMDAGRMLEISRKAQRQEQEFYSRYENQISKGTHSSIRFKRYWKEKNKALQGQY